MATTSRKRTKTNLLSGGVVKDIPDYYCRKCKKTFSNKKNFYFSTNDYLDTNGVMSICKQCCNDIYDDMFNTHKEASRAIYETCKELDVCFSYNAFDMAYSQFLTVTKRNEKNNELSDDFYLFAIYKSKLSTIGSKNIGQIGMRFKDSDAYKFDSDSVSDGLVEKTPEEKLDYYKKKWGEGKDLWEYEYLENELFMIKSSFACEDYGMELIQKDIAFLNLAIEKDRKKGGDASKLIKARGELMQDAKMKPIQSSGIESNDAITFGTLIKKFENERPIPAYMDDQMKRYIDTFMIGQLAKIEGMENDITKRMDVELQPYSIDFDSLDQEEENTDVEV